MSSRAQPRKTCPRCGAEVGNLPAHLRRSCPERPEPVDDREPINGGNVDKVTAKECRRMRQLIAEVDTASAVASRVGRTPDTVCKHIQGRCWHDLAAPTYFWSASRTRWIEA